jgi:hypothetical protein
MPAGPHVSQATQRVSTKAGMGYFVRKGYNERIGRISYGYDITPNMHEV